ncbi:MAG: nuclear transport factor 2 family protein [Pyrinomonadaceae bacterium]|nr:nuclear transport factor 2 family protein [Pyrinomonadaceae bacterium]
MKNVILATAFLVLLAAVATSQSAGEIEAIVRKHEVDQVKFLLAGDLAAMKKQWSEEFTVNNPFNVVQEGKTGPIQKGVLTYTRFERNIEKVMVRGDVAIVMGNELVVPKTAPKGSSHDTTAPIRRRFTNIWMNFDGKWLMFARHANRICTE